VNPGMADYIRSALKVAKKEKAQGLIIALNTPGGLLSTTRDLVSLFLTSEIPVIVYVAPSGAHAGSAGVMLTMSAHLAFMAPATNIGAAHPVSAGGKDIDKTMGQKILNDTLAFVESIAKERGRNITFAKDSVRNSASIVADEALKRKVIDGIAASVDDLLSQIDGKQVKINSFEKVVMHTKKAKVIPIEMNIKQVILTKMADPNIAYMLMALGGIGIYVEITNPGLIVPGVVGGISIILSMICFQMLPINFGALALLLLGLALLIAEAFVPSFGALGIGGIVSFIFGSLFLIDSDIPALQIDKSLIFTVAGCLLVIMIFIGMVIVRARKYKQTSGQDGIVGENGEVVLDIEKDKKGKVFVHGEVWNAYSSDGSVIKKGANIEIVKAEGMVLYVKSK